MPPLLPDEDKNFAGSFVLDFRKWWRHVKTIYYFYSKLTVFVVWIEIVFIFAQLFRTLKSLLLSPSISTGANFLRSHRLVVFVMYIGVCVRRNCSLTCVVRAEECRCCVEVNRCTERMEEVEKDGQCITTHPGFNSVCLDRWVLQTAGIGLKTKSKKSYTTMLTLGDRAEAE